MTPSRAHRLTQALVLNLLWLPLSVLAAGVCNTNNPDPDLGLQAFESAADANPLGRQIGNIGMAREARVFDGRGIAACRLKQAWATPANPVVNGVTYLSPSGTSYDVFETGIPGIGYAIGITDYGDSTFNYQPLKASGDTITFNGPQVTESIGYSVQVVFVATGSLESGEYTLNNKILTNFFALTTNETVESDAYIQVSATFRITALTCQVLNGPTYNMTLQRISVDDFEDVPIGGAPSNTPRSNPVTINLNCEPNIALHATMTDNNDQGSTLNYLQASTGPAMAQGVGVQMFLNGATIPLSMGPDSSAIGNTHQWFLQDTGPSGSPVSFTLDSQYVRTDNTLRGGAVEAVATITFSYQ